MDTNSFNIVVNLISSEMVRFTLSAIAVHGPERKIDCIKSLRAQMSKGHDGYNMLGLKDAKDIVEAHLLSSTRGATTAKVVATRWLEEQIAPTPVAVPLVEDSFVFVPFSSGDFSIGAYIASTVAEANRVRAFSSAWGVHGEVYKKV